jgi:SNF2 family DNA or RNA helicase
MVVITSYDTFLRSPELLEINWDRTICDEAHRLRNPKTKLYNQIGQLRTNILWCITGTPIHNKIKDVMSLFALYGVGVGGKIEEDVYKNMILRRTKSTTNLLLPKKTEKQEIISWSNPEEWKLAKDVHMSMMGTRQEKEDSFWNTKQINELVTMIRAKQLCILPKLLEKTIQKLELDEPDDLFPTEFKNTTRQHTSCKLKAIIRHILTRVNNGRGKIIFCHFQLEMTKIAELLREDILNNNDVWIGNWREYSKNKDKIDKPNKILIMQIRSGCEGLNLQKDFSEIYFVSPNWNPTLEEQAIARCHRIGQQKEVFVFRFYMDNLLSESEIIEETKSKRDIMTYGWIINKIPDDITRYIHEFLVNDTYMPKNIVYSIDMYTLFKQNEKRKQISEFLNKITIY